MLRGAWRRLAVFGTLWTGFTALRENCTGSNWYTQDCRCGVDGVIPNNDGRGCCGYKCSEDGSSAWDINICDIDRSVAWGCSHSGLGMSAALTPCSTTSTQELIVNDTASATAMAGAVSCSGGLFKVIWEGGVSINHTIYVGHGTTLSITGTGTSAEIIGGWRHQLLNVKYSSSLHLTNIQLSGGMATNGGAVAVFGSTLILNQTRFLHNNASFHGGAVHASQGSTLIFNKTTFRGNNASLHGGAVHASQGSTLIFNNTAFLRNNASLHGGAVHASHGSKVIWYDEMLFEGNCATSCGGALHLENGSSASCSHGLESMESALPFDRTDTFSYLGTTRFRDNEAQSGGAICIEDGSTVGWSARTLYSGNRAEQNGGALYVMNESSVFWDSPTEFCGNVGGSGGALFLEESSRASWESRTNFSNNMALGEGALTNTILGHGGGVLIRRNSTISWSEDTLYSSNLARFSGGGLHVAVDSSTSWNASTSFSHNIAGYGGGMLLFGNSTASWAAETNFTGNIASTRKSLCPDSVQSQSWVENTNFFKSNADSSGGAVFVTGGSGVSSEARTVFIGNSALENGGGLYVYEKSPTDPSSVDMDGDTLFIGNECGGSGGGMTIIAATSVSFGEVGLRFEQNSANVSGGAVFVSSVGVGPNFTGSVFVSNSASVGGGVYVTGSGTDAQEDGINEGNKLLFYPTVFDRCLFIGNTALVTGGALESTAGRDAIMNSLFKNNTALVGGALRLAGTTYIADCKFQENTSSENKGSAIYNIGNISHMTGVEFDHNEFRCSPGKFLDVIIVNQSEAFYAACRGCEFAGDDAVQYEILRKCRLVLPHTSSDGGNCSLETLLIHEGYWRVNNKSEVVLPCLNPRACAGGRTGAPDVCRDGYRGPFCSVCAARYMAGFGHTCHKRPQGITRVIGAVITGLVAFVLIATLSYLARRAVSRESTDADCDGMESEKRGAMQSLKMVIVAWQIVTQFSSVANVIYPEVYQRFLDGADIINFDFGWILWGGLHEVDFHARLIVSTTGPLLVLAFVGATCAVQRYMNRISPDAFEATLERHLSRVLCLTFLVYSPVSSTLFRMFACDDLDDDTNFLIADYRIDCHTPRHRALQAYSAVMIVIYTAGIPALYFALLFGNSEAFSKGHTRGTNVILRSTADLWGPYRPECFCYELIECYRRVTLAGIVVLIYPNTTTQVAIVLPTAIFFMILSEALAPYVSRLDAWESRMGHGTVIPSMYLALLLKVDVAGEEARSQEVFASILVFVHGWMVFVVVADAVMVIRHSLKDFRAEQPRRRVHPRSELPIIHPEEKNAYEDADADRDIEVPRHERSCTC